MKTASHWALLSVGSLLAGAVPLQGQQRMYASDERISISKDAPVPGRIDRVSVKGSDATITIPPVMPAPAFRIEDYRDLNENNLAYYIATRDTFEVRLAAIAQQKAVDSRVRDVAMVIERDRMHRLAETKDVLTHDDVGTEPLARDAELARLRELVVVLDALPSGQEFDAAYLRSVFFLHQNELDVLSANLKNAHDDDFEDVLEDSFTPLTRTRDVVRTIAQSLGVSLP
jgi:predicted outer membrane protein